MEPTPEDKEFLQAGGTTPEGDKAESVKMVEVLNLLHCNLVNTTRLMWVQFFFIGALVIFLFITYFSLLSKIPSASDVAALGPKSLAKPLPTSENTISPQVPQTEKSEGLTDILEREEVRGVLDQVRKAQLAKDINLFLQAYSPTYPNLAEKKASLLRSWQKYNYLDMNFNIENIQKKNAHTIIAEVACDISLEDIHSKKRGNLMKDYIINFSNVSGKSLIQEVTKGKKSNRGGRSGLNDRML
jgi:hypothetical protein